MQRNRRTCPHPLGEKTSTESAYDSDKMSDLSEKDFKVVIKTYVQVYKEKEYHN